MQNPRVASAENTLVLMPDSVFFWEQEMAANKRLYLAGDKIPAFFSVSLGCCPYTSHVSRATGLLAQGMTSELSIIHHRRASKFILPYDSLRLAERQLPLRTWLYFSTENTKESYKFWFRHIMLSFLSSHSRASNNNSLQCLP